MSKKTTVFLSSTWDDLEEHRESVLRTLARFKRQVTGMEYFGARSDAPLQVCLDEVRESGIYIGIIGTRYGSIARDGKSFTELEYEEALKHDKTILIYLLNEATHPVLPKHVDKGDNAERLSIFKHRLQSNHVCKPFSSSDDLVSQIAFDLIHTFQDIGVNVRAAMESDLSHLLVEAGYLFSSEVALTVSLEPDLKSLGGFRFGDKDLEAVMAAAFLAQRLRNNKFDVLRPLVTIRNEVWEPLIYFLKRSDINENALKDQILHCSDSFQLRLLIRLAGKLNAAACTEAICKRLFDKESHHKIINSFQLQVTPFNKVVEEALKEMPGSLPVIEKYVQSAKSRRNWQAKHTLERVLKAKLSIGQSSDPDGPSIN